MGRHILGQVHQISRFASRPEIVMEVQTASAPFPAVCSLHTNRSSRKETCIGFNLYLSSWWPGPSTPLLEARITPIIPLIPNGPRCAIRKLTWFYTTGGVMVSPHNYTIMQPDALRLIAGVWRRSWRAPVCHMWDKLSEELPVPQHLLLPVWMADVSQSCCGSGVYCFSTGVLVPPRLCHLHN